MSDRKHWPELSIENVGPGPFEDDREVFLCSIAISLKRIADLLSIRDPYENPIAQAIQSGIYNGAQEWIAHLVRNGR